MGVRADQSQCQTCQLESESRYKTVPQSERRRGGDVCGAPSFGDANGLQHGRRHRPNVSLARCLMFDVGSRSHTLPRCRSRRRSFFLLHTAEEGSWRLTAANMSGFSEADLSFEVASPFATVLSMIQSGLYATVQSKLGLDLHGS